ncbi:hypothetical protein [Draconibacterium orientale]|uniref:hypothetical protein n=1 Tax=Draconibacterium orientale TaxID=1168034 RepID=UPI0029C053EF|nr:hypothetical protein [Draconibacterium orientale]
MKEKVKKVVDQGNQLIAEIKTNDDPKQVILLNRAKLSLKTFQITINKLIE